MHNSLTRTHAQLGFGAPGLFYAGSIQSLLLNFGGIGSKDYVCIMDALLKAQENFQKAAQRFGGPVDPFRKVLTYTVLQTVWQPQSSELHESQVSG